MSIWVVLAGHDLEPFLPPAFHLFFAMNCPAQPHRRSCSQSTPLVHLDFSSILKAFPHSEKHPGSSERGRSTKRTEAQSVKASPVVSRRRSRNCSSAAKSRSLYHLSVQHRNSLWLARKEKKLYIQQQAEQAKVLDGCTFRPVIYSRIPHVLQQCAAEDLLAYESLRAELECRQPEEGPTLCGLSPYRPSITPFNPVLFLQHLSANNC